MLRACILEWGGHWESYVPLAEFSYNNSYQASIKMAPFELLYGRKCRSPLCWEEVGEGYVVGPQIIEDSIQQVKLVRERLKAAQDRQKAWADKGRREEEYQVGEQVFIKMTPMKGVRRFGKGDKLKPRYIGPFEITQRVGPVAYRLRLPEELSGVHSVFHVSMLKKYVRDPKHQLKHETIEVEEGMKYQEYPIRILDRKTKELRNRTIPLVLVQWNRHSPKEATWETEQDMMQKHPHLFSNNTEE